MGSQHLMEVLERIEDICAKFIKDFSGPGYIVAPNCKLCWFCKNYYNTLFDNSSLHNDAKNLGENIFEFSDFLVNVLKMDDFGAVLPGLATFTMIAVAALRECKIKEEPRKIIGKRKGLQLTEMNDVETCCGFGGTFAVKFEPISIAMADQKSQNATATGPTTSLAQT